MKLSIFFKEKVGKVRKISKTAIFGQKRDSALAHRPESLYVRKYDQDCIIKEALALGLNFLCKPELMMNILIKN